ncbi:hypothetical protein PYCC9005_004695 [Savitreella phatthalungensis]
MPTTVPHASAYASVGHDRLTTTLTAADEALMEVNQAVTIEAEDFGGNTAELCVPSSDHATKARGRRPRTRRSQHISKQNHQVQHARDWYLPHHLSTSSLSAKRLRPLQLSFLRPGARFVGTQKSGRATYEVGVELKHVDMADSFLCGYLRISGLSEEHPTLTTYFEGEVVGPKYSFITKRPEWGTTETIDVEHWARFPAFKNIVLGQRKREKERQALEATDRNAAAKAAMDSADIMQSDGRIRSTATTSYTNPIAAVVEGNGAHVGQGHIFMRWKELLVVPPDEAGLVASRSPSAIDMTPTASTASHDPYASPLGPPPTVDVRRSSLAGGNPVSSRFGRATNSLDGVSFSGFYYICLDQSTGTISGMYFHRNSELYQQLSLDPAPESDQRQFSSFEWR